MAPYVYRVAISNRRLICCEPGPDGLGRVTFTYRQRQSPLSVMTVTAERFGRRPPLAEPAVSLHVPPHRGIGPQGPPRRKGLDPGGQVVVVQLVAPVLVSPILGQQLLDLDRGQGDFATVLADDPPQDADRVPLLAPGAA